MTKEVQDVVTRIYEKYFGDVGMKTVGIFLRISGV